ncbi:hypothetical protein ACIQV3_40555 [Streptomyces sp. NPDC099050]|uniref:hypothetical protein n=1 Tax=Streptomyces sp. NPDC099050 TaxID=3366100 RepID=UPI0038295EC0
MNVLSGKVQIEVTDQLSHVVVHLGHQEASHHVLPVVEKPLLSAEATVTAPRDQPADATQDAQFTLNTVR